MPYSCHWYYTTECVPVDCTVQAELLQHAIASYDVQCEAAAGSGRKTLLSIAALQQLDSNLERVQVLVVCHQNSLANEVLTSSNMQSRFIPVHGHVRQGFDSLVILMIVYIYVAKLRFLFAHAAVRRVFAPRVPDPRANNGAVYLVCQEVLP